MNRYCLTVPEHMHGSRLLLFLARAYPLAPDLSLGLALKRRDIKVDRQRASNNQSLAAGQMIEWYTDWAPPTIPVVHRDDRLLIINKPCGISSDQQAGEQMTLLGLLTQQLNLASPPRLVHRLDNQTSGLMALALSDEAEQILIQAFRQGLVQKNYTCLVGGAMPRQRDILKAWLRKDARNARVQVLDFPAADTKEIITEYRVLAADASHSRLEITLHTGRTHQIRAHMAHVGHPLVGDDKYGDRALNRSLGAGRLMLAATGLALHAGGALADLDGKTFFIEAPF